MSMSMNSIKASSVFTGHLTENVGNRNNYKDIGTHNTFGFTG